MVVVPIVLAVAACWGLWRFGRTQPNIVVAGFLIRALLGQALFWISYLKLPFARSLQLGNGFWFFAVDGPFYLGYATDLAAGGPLAILRDAGQYPSRFFVQILALCVTAFGSVASVAILLNCTAYLLTCWLIVRVARSRNRVVLAAIAFSPASILFSLQPLKDTLFQLLIVAIVVTCKRLEEVAREQARTRFVGYALAACALLFALGGIRWYFAVIAWGAAAVFLLLIVLQVRPRGWVIVTSAVVVLVMAQSIRVGASDLPVAYDRLLNPMTAVQWRPSATREHIADVRRGFDSTPGATTIAEGAAIAPAPVAAPVAAPAVVPTPVAEAPAPVVAPPPASTTVAAEPEPAPVAAAPPTTTTVTAEPVPAPDLTPTEPGPQEPARNLSKPARRILTGFAAMFLPRMLGERLGIVHVGGGRGLWIFAEADTILFDFVLLYAIVYCIRSLKRRTATITATFVFCVLVFAGTAAPMLYTVNNFGTLFRLRMMVFCLAAILPITLREKRSPDASQHPEIETAS